MRFFQIEQVLQIIQVHVKHSRSSNDCWFHSKFNHDRFKLIKIFYSLKTVFVFRNPFRLFDLQSRPCCKIGFYFIASFDRENQRFSNAILQNNRKAFSFLFSFIKEKILQGTEVFLIGKGSLYFRMIQVRRSPLINDKI